jgi:hypothetical protein
VRRSEGVTDGYDYDRGGDTAGGLFAHPSSEDEAHSSERKNGEKHVVPRASIRIDL